LSDDEQQDDQTKDDNEQQEDQKKDDNGGGGTDAETAFEEYAGENKCPECDEPVIEVRANCPNCGYEYKESDYSDEEAGSEFVSGSAVDDEGNEITDHPTGNGEGEDDGSDDENGEGEDDGSDDENGEGR